MECHNSINLHSETEMEVISVQPVTALPKKLMPKLLLTFIKSEFCLL